MNLESFTTLFAIFMIFVTLGIICSFIGHALGGTPIRTAIIALALFGLCASLFMYLIIWLFAIDSINMTSALRATVRIPNLLQAVAAQSWLITRCRHLVVF